MKATGTRRLALVARRSIVCAALAGCLALTAAGCGDSDSDSAGATSSKEERRELDALMDDFREALAKSDGKLGCSLLAAKFRESLAAFVPAVPVAGTTGAVDNCADGFRALSKQPLTEDFHPKILDVRIGVRRAAITGWVSHLEERQTARFVKEDGDWKIETWVVGA
jgi:hypothetical protein